MANHSQKKPQCAMINGTFGNLLAIRSIPADSYRDPPSHARSPLRHRPGQSRNRVHQFLIVERKTAQRRMQFHPLNPFWKQQFSRSSAPLPVPDLPRRTESAGRIFIHVIHDLSLLKYPSVNGNMMVLSTFMVSIRFTLHALAAQTAAPFPSANVHLLSASVIPPMNLPCSLIRLVPRLR